MLWLSSLLHLIALLPTSDITVQSGVKASKSYSVTQVGMCPVCLVESVFPLDNHAQMLVIKNEGLDLQLLNFGCGKLLAIHQEAAISIDVNHSLCKRREYIILWQKTFDADYIWPQSSSETFDISINMPVCLGTHIVDESSSGRPDSLLLVSRKGSV